MLIFLHFMHDDVISTLCLLAEYFVRNESGTCAVQGASNVLVSPYTNKDESETSIFDF